jgi:hypothetical protein
VIKYATLKVTTDSSGAGTVTGGPINGEILEVCTPGTALSGTADWTLVRAGAFGGTILAITDAQEPWWYRPRSGAVGVTGSAVTDSNVKIPCDGEVKLTVSQAGSVLSSTVTIFYET